MLQPVKNMGWMQEEKRLHWPADRSWPWALSPTCSRWGGTDVAVLAPAGMVQDHNWVGGAERLFAVNQAGERHGMPGLLSHVAALELAALELPHGMISKKWHSQRRRRLTCGSHTRRCCRSMSGHLKVQVKRLVRPCGHAPQRHTTSRHRCTCKLSRWLSQSAASTLLTIVKVDVSLLWNFAPGGPKNTYARGAGCQLCSSRVRGPVVPMAALAEAMAASQSLAVAARRAVSQTRSASFSPGAPSCSARYLGSQYGVAPGLCTRRHRQCPHSGASRARAFHCTT